MYTVEVKDVGGEYILHSTHESYRDAVDQADMVHGRVVLTATGLSDKKAWIHAVSEQGFTGDFAAWQGQDDEDRNAFEVGAGI